MDSKEYSIIDVAQYGDALRSTGYKNIESAMSEIIDNSLEAGAKNVYVVLEEKLNPSVGKKRITNIYFLDDGCGMNIEELHKCLILGSGTKKDRKGMGRFGVGLPQSSMYATPSVDVYSWKDSISNAYKNTLDINEVKNGNQSSFSIPVKKCIPDVIDTCYVNSRLSVDGKRIINSCKEHGTLVVWRDCDNVTPSTFSGLKKRLERELGRRFRYLIDNDKANIYVIDHNNLAYDNSIHKIVPNDPLLLMENNFMRGNTANPGNPFYEKNKGEVIFEPYDVDYPNGVCILPVTYIDRNDGQSKESNVIITFSIVKKLFYDKDAFPDGKNPGTSTLGKEVAKLEGISVVRANREIDFGKFDFYMDKNEPVHRWWGCEIKFEPELDEIFGVSNNKQHVELIKIDEDELSEYDESDIKPIWIALNNIISRQIKSMAKRNKEIRNGSRTNTSQTANGATGIINTVENEDDTPTNSLLERSSFTEIEIKDEAKNVAIDTGIIEPNENDIAQIMNNKVNFVYQGNPFNSTFFDYRHSRGIVQCVVNTDHEFYTKFAGQMIQSSDFNRKCFELMFGAMATVLDKSTDDNVLRIYQRLLQKWGLTLQDYMDRVE